MTTSPSKVQLLEIGRDEVKAYAPMTPQELQQFMTTKYADQPVSYFNSERRLYVVIFGEKPVIRPLSVRVEI